MQEQHGVDQGGHSQVSDKSATESVQAVMNIEQDDYKPNEAESRVQNQQLAEILEKKSREPQIQKQIAKKIKSGFLPDLESKRGEAPFLKWLLMFLLLMTVLAGSAMTAEADETDRDPYYETGYEVIDQGGTLEVNAPEILYSDYYTMAMTVNIYDGTVTVFSLDGNGGTEQVFQTYALVGQRLFLDSEPRDALSMFPDQFDTFSNGGLYDPDNGVFHDEFGFRHTLTPPMIADFQGFAKIDGFGGLPVATDIGVIRSMGENGEVSESNSQFTFHEVPPLVNDHYDGRRAILAEANEEGHPAENPYWSHGCVNIAPDQFDELKVVLSTEERNGGEVAIIFSTPGQDQSDHFRGTDFDGMNDLFFNDNLSQAVSEVNFSAIPFGETLTPDSVNGDGESTESSNSTSSVENEVDEKDETAVEVASESQTEEFSASQAVPTEVENEQGEVEFVLPNWHEGETFLDYSVSERAPGEIRELPFFARDMITVYIEESQLRDSTLSRENLAQEGLALWSFAFPDGNTNPSQRTEVQSDIFDALYLNVDTWTMADVRAEWLRGAYNSN